MGRSPVRTRFAVRGRPLIPAWLGARYVLSIVKVRFWLPGRFIVAGFRGRLKKCCPLGGPRVRIHLPPAEVTSPVIKIASSGSFPSVTSDCCERYGFRIESGRSGPRGNE